MYSDRVRIGGKRIFPKAQHLLMWSSKRTPRVFFNPEARATMVALLIQVFEHLLIYLQVGRGVSQISQGHVLSNLKLILYSINHTLCFFDALPTL